jgi:hypothetical protein
MTTTTPDDQPADDEVLTDVYPPRFGLSRLGWPTKFLIGFLGVLGAGVAIVFVIGLLGGRAPLAGTKSTPAFVAARESCDPASLGTIVADGNKTLLVNGKGGEDATGVPVETEACILQKLGASSAVTAHMESTRALDGRQTDTWGDYKAAWTYHPDSGLDIVIQLS